jgi:hypothetical protein
MRCARFGKKLFFLIHPGNRDRASMFDVSLGAIAKNGASPKAFCALSYLSLLVLFMVNAVHEWRP